MTHDVLHLTVSVVELLLEILCLRMTAPKGGQTASRSLIRVTGPGGTFLVRLSSSSASAASSLTCSDTISGRGCSMNLDGEGQARRAEVNGARPWAHGVRTSNAHLADALVHPHLLARILLLGHGADLAFSERENPALLLLGSDLCLDERELLARADEL